jgi:nucleoporin NUP82
MLAVYETIDLGLVSLLGQISASQFEEPILNLLQGNYPSLVSDPIHNETVYVYHAFGVHSLHLGPMIKNLLVIFSEEEGEQGTSIDTILDETCGTDVCSILNTLSVERKSAKDLLRVQFCC